MRTHPATMALADSGFPSGGVDAGKPLPGPDGQAPGVDGFPLLGPGSGHSMTQERPDADGRDEPAGTPSPGPDHLTDKPATPGTDDAGKPTAVPGAHEADDARQERGRAVKPGT